MYVRDFDYDTRIADIQNAIQHSAPVTDVWECGVDIMGESHADGMDCPNSAWDEIESKLYCSIQHSRKLKLRKDVYQWLPAMVKCYWQTGIQTDDLEFLEAGNFVTSYRYETLYLFLFNACHLILLYSSLALDTGCDATSPYGQVIYGFELIEGWHTRYLMFLVMASLFLSACVVAITTAILQDFEAGLTAGSYALAITTVVLAVLTFLSAII